MVQIACPKTYLLTHSMEQSPYWEANRFSASQEIPRILWNPKVHYRIHKCPPPAPIQTISPGPRLFVWTFRNKIRFYSEELLVPPPTAKSKDHPLSALRNCLFNIFAATLHIGGRSSIRNVMTRHALVTVIHLSRGCPETSMWNCHYSLRNNPEERSSLDLHNLKSSNKESAGGAGVAPAGDGSDDNRSIGL
jgi:hypothetical protein